MSNVYSTSDLHEGHTNICKYTNRLAETTAELHDSWLIEVWNKQVRPNDVVYHLGDLSFSKYDRVAKFISKLNGKLKLIKGNHDSSKNLDRLVKDGWIDSWEYYKEIKIADVNTVLFHFPIAVWHKQGYGGFHLYGHSHGSFKSLGKALDVGLDNSYNLYGTHRLFSEQDVLEQLLDRPVWIAYHHKEL